MATFISKPASSRKQSPLSFIDYMRIKQTLEKSGSVPTSQITNHNNDKVTYADLYTALIYTAKDSQKYTDMYSATLIDTLGFVVDFLKENKLISDSDYQKLLDQIKNIWGVRKK